MVEPLILVTNILAAATSLLAIRAQLKAMQRENQRQVAKLFEQIAASLTFVSSEIRLGRIPRGECEKINQYSVALGNHLVKDAATHDSADLANILRSSYAVENLAIQLTNEADKEPYLKSIDEAAGKFGALANIVRPGL